MRVLVIADTHANLTALDAVLAAVGGWDACWNLGDSVGYGPDPGACIARLREVDTLSVSGNHDLAASGDLPLDTFNPVAAEAVRLTQSQLTAPEVDWLRALPQTLVRNEGFTLVHGSPRFPAWEYLHYADDALENFGRLETPWCLVGHTHRPVFFELRDGDCRRREWEDGVSLNLKGRRLILNPGSVGQPRDGDPRAACAVYDSASQSITLHRVVYNVTGTQERMRAAGLPDPLARRLGFGL